MDTIEDTCDNIKDIDMFIQDIQSILKDINESHEKKREEIREHYKNIASKPKEFYAEREQVAVLLEIMKCYNINMAEYQKTMRDLGVITKTLMKAHNEKAFSNKIRPSEETQQQQQDTSYSLYDYFMEILWGKPKRKTSISPGGEPVVDLAFIFMDTEEHVIEYSFENETAKLSLHQSSPTIKKTAKRRNTIQPVITYHKNS